jgi:flagellar protein FlgJ
MVMLKSTGMADVYTDFSGMARLKAQAKQDPQAAIKETAQQFESLFMQMALKNMRNANAPLAKNSLMEGQQTQFFREMYDQQLAVELSKSSSLGMANLLTQQLGGGTGTSNHLSGKGVDSYRAAAFPRVRGEEVTREERPYNSPKLNTTSLSSSATLSSGSTSFDSPEEFANTLWPAAQAAAAELGVDPKLLLAQAALETGWGKSILRQGDRTSHNLFGIKADRSWNGERASTSTLEYSEGVAVRSKAAFRVYQDYAESFQDYVNFLKSNPRYSKALENVENPQRFMLSLQKAGYATDPHYARKVLSIYQHDALDKLST